MRRLLAAALAAACALSASGPAAPPPEVRLPAWLAGCWSGESNGARFEEMWMGPSGGTMIGTSRMVRDSKTVTYEFMRIYRDPAGELVFAARPNGEAGADFRLIAHDAAMMRFENPAHDFPRIVEYRLEAGGNLVASIAGPGSDGQIRTIPFHLKKIACPGR